MGGGCSDGTNEDVSFHLSTAECANRMAAFCSPVTHWPYGVNQDYPSSTCCSGPGCPFDPRPELQNVSGTCGSDDTIPDGCVDGGYVDIPGPTWTCEGNGTGTDATCPLSSQPLDSSSADGTRNVKHAESKSGQENLNDGPVQSTRNAHQGYVLPVYGGRVY